MAKNNDENKIVTIAEMFKLDQKESVKLPDSFLNALQPDSGSSAVIILTPHTKIIRIIPTASQKVHRITINIGKLTPDFLRKIGNLFIEMDLKSIYSTGLCFFDTKCVFEGYIDSPDYERIDVKKLKKSIMKVDGITGIEFSTLEV